MHGTFGRGDRCLWQRPERSSLHVMIEVGPEQGGCDHVVMFEGQAIGFPRIEDPRPWYLVRMENGAFGRAPSDELAATEFV